MKHLLYLICLTFPFELFCKSVPDSAQTIDLQHKRLLKLPDNFAYQQVQTLHLGYNPFKVIPAELINAKHLKHLSINYNTQFDLENSIGTIKQLPLISLSMNSSALMYLPLEIGEMKYLNHLSITNNYIRELPEYIFINSNFHTLDISGNLIATMPKEIGSQSDLSTLDISYNPCINTAITYEKLYALKNLQQLGLRGAEKLPEQLWQLKWLTQLNISEGTFTEIKLPAPPYKHNLTQLIANDCNNLDFKTLMPLLTSTSLKEVTLGGTGFKGFDRAELSAGITHLILNGDNLAHFSFSAAPLNLEELILDFKTISCQTELIGSLAKINKLKMLNLSNCNLTFLPNQLSQLQSLEVLNLSGNKFTNPRELFALKQLKELDISLCELTKEEIEKLKKELPNTTIICNQAYDKLPLPNATVSTESFSVSPSDPQTIVTQNGTTISIPKNSLVYENGKPVKEPVTINYTPYYSLADIATSGINMNYVSKDGSSAPFTSAGMFNISASVNGQAIELKKGKEITIAFKSNDPDKSYNYYAYDSIKRTWTETGKDTITKVKVAKAQDSIVVNQRNTLPPSNLKMPQPPSFYKDHGMTIKWHLNDHKKLDGIFNLDVEMPKKTEAYDTSYGGNFFVEAEGLSKVSWKIDLEKAVPVLKEFFKENKIFNTVSEMRPLKLKPRYHISAMRTDKHIEFDLIADKEHDNFIFKFYNETDTVIFHAYPLVQNKNPDREQKKIKKLFFTYKASADKRKAVTKYRRDKFLASYRRFQNEMAQYRQNFNAVQNRNFTDLINDKVNTDAYGVTRILSLQGFGTFNCDRPVVVENPIVFAPVFYNENGKRMRENNFQMIDIKENIVVSYYINVKVKASKNSILTFLYNGGTYNSPKMYIGKMNTFDAEKHRGSVPVVLSVVPPETTLGELSSFINATQ